MLILLGVSLSAEAFAEAELFGAAAIVGAVSPMVTSAIQAGADVAIARTNSQTSIATTKIAADTSMYLANLQAQTAYSQLAATMSINAINQQGTSDRLMAQLGELSNTRRDNLLMEREKMSMEWGLNQQRIGLAHQQANENAQLGRVALSTQLTWAGLGGQVPLTSSALQTTPQTIPWTGPQLPLSAGAYLPVTRVFNPSRVGSQYPGQYPSQNPRMPAVRRRVRGIQSPSFVYPSDVGGSTASSMRRQTQRAPVYFARPPNRRIAGDWGARVRGIRIDLPSNTHITRD